MAWFRKRHSCTRLGVVIIIIGLLWLGQRIGWFPSKLFGPLVLVTIGVWLVLASSVARRQVLLCKGANHEFEIQQRTKGPCSR